jgi:hypothetical protein
MYSIMWAHNVVGPSTRFFKGFPVVIRATQITNDVPFSQAYYRDIRHYPSRHSDLTHRGGATHVVHTQAKGPWFEGRQIEQVSADELADGNKVGEFC